jgi:ATP-dependent Clp protease adaptor protein ClpS
MTEIEDDYQATVLEKPAPKVKKPAMYRVILINDDFTPRAFVVHVLSKYFKKEEYIANTIMLVAHKSGFATVAIYSFEIAETKSNNANNYALANNYPLKFIFEEDN